MAKRSPFDYVKSINSTKEYLMETSDDINDYNAFIVNRTLGHFLDTVLYANMMNKNSHLDKKMQYDYLFHSIRKKYRFSKYDKKPEKDKNIELIMDIYKYNYLKAKEVYSILSEEQISELKKRQQKGGNK